MIWMEGRLPRHDAAPWPQTPSSTPVPLPTTTRLPSSPIHTAIHLQSSPYLLLSPTYLIYLLCLLDRHTLLQTNNIDSPSTSDPVSSGVISSSPAFVSPERRTYRVPHSLHLSGQLAHASNTSPNIPKNDVNSNTSDHDITAQQELVHTFHTILSAITKKAERHSASAQRVIGVSGAWKLGGALSDSNTRVPRGLVPAAAPDHHDHLHPPTLLSSALPAIRLTTARFVIVPTAAAATSQLSSLFVSPAIAISP